MGIESINEPGSGHITMLTPVSINEPIRIDDLNPPKITGIDPAGCVVGDPSLTLDVTGTGFVDGIVVTMDGLPLTTVFVSDTELTAAVDTAGFVAAGGHPVTVQVGAYEAQPAVMFTVSDVARKKAHTIDPDDLEEDIEEAEEEGDFKPTHPTPKKKKR